MKPNRSAGSLRPSLLVLLAVVLAAPLSTFAGGQKTKPVGTWYLALDAAPFGLPEGLSLPGLMTLHADQTVLVSDAGDFGGVPFNTKDSSQFGSWRLAHGHVQIVTLFLQADAAGEVRSWFRVQLKLRQQSRNRLNGTVNVYQLPCDIPAPAAAFSCPDPIRQQGDFVLAPGPTDVPVTLRRLAPQFLPGTRP